MTGPPLLAAATLPGLLTLAVGAYCLLSIVLLLAYARTRLYPLYLLKIAWVGVTIVGFVWIVAMSMADPGPKHGGQHPEFMRNPAGPFAALAHYAPVARTYLGTGPAWIFLGAALLLLWRGLSAGPSYGPATSRGRTVRRAFLAASAALAAALALGADAGSAGAARYGGAVILLAASAAWVALPMPAKRRLAAPALLGLGVLALVPLAVALARYDWSAYRYAAANYAYAWKTARMGSYMLNSVMVSLATVGITLVCASMAAHALTRFDFVGRNALLMGFIGAMVIPAELYIVPLFLMVQKWQFTLGGLHVSFMDSRLGLSLIYAAAGLPFATFLLTGFFRTLPGTLREAAALDGCSEWRTFTDVYFPLAAPGLATAAIFQFLGVWNEYQLALVFLTNDKLKTLPVGLYNLSVSQQYAANWSALFAGVTILCLPTFLIFVILQERIVAGLTVGAVKE